MGGGRGDKNRDKMSITTAQGFLVEDGNEGGCSAHLIIINHQKSSAANSLVYREFLLWFWRRWREFEGRQDKVQASSFLYSLATLFKKENMSKSSSSSELLPFGSLSNSPENHELESCLPQNSKINDIKMIWIMCLIGTSKQFVTTKSGEFVKIETRFS